VQESALFTFTLERTSRNLVAKPDSRSTLRSLVSQREKSFTLRKVSVPHRENRHV